MARMLSSTKQVLFSKEISISPSPDDFSEHEKKINTGRVFTTDYYSIFYR